MTARSILKSYFLTGKKPTQGQFAALIDSFLHLSEDSLSISQITNLAAVLAGKASTTQIDALTTALMAKADLSKVILQYDNVTKPDYPLNQYVEFNGQLYCKKHPDSVAGEAPGGGYKWLKLSAYYAPYRLVSGGNVTLAGTQVTVSPAMWRLQDTYAQTNTPTTFTLNFCATGLQKFVVFTGRQNGTIGKLEGAEAVTAVEPVIPNNQAFLRRLLVTDGVINPTEALENEVTNKFTSATVSILTTDNTVAINWDATKIATHGLEPFDIQLYEVQPDGSLQKSTALLQVNQAKTVYSFYVGENSNLNFYYKII
ncbi:MAG: hypothetical protein EAY81_10515 [Bacteroidetes bacterium]|nr:MAG: hypothetical protein EAY81_10515 [Bacteroidota bacterium]